MIRRIPITGPTIITLVACVLMIAVVVMHIPGLVGAVLSGGSGDNDPASVVAQLMDDHEKDLLLYRDRFTGRSFFYKPQPPPPPRRVVREPEPEPEPVVRPAPVVQEPVEKGPPPNYQGPSVLYVVGDDVWFKPTDPDAKELRIRKGETREGVTVINCDKLPYSVRVGYRNGEYDVKIFDPNTLFADQPPAAAAAYPGIEEAPEGAQVQPVSNPAPPPPAVREEEREKKLERYKARESDSPREDEADQETPEPDRDDPADGPAGPPSLR